MQDAPQVSDLGFGVLGFGFRASWGDPRGGSTCAIRFLRRFRTRSVGAGFGGWGVEGERILALVA